MNVVYEPKGERRSTRNSCAISTAVRAWLPLLLCICLHADLSACTAQAGNPWKIACNGLPRKDILR
jgi:hypothetical protein